MNNVTCGIAEDLLPLYMDGCCSKDSRQAVEEHMRTCEKCRKKYLHLQNTLPTIAAETSDIRTDEIALSLSKKMRKRKLFVTVFTVILGLLAVLFLFFIGKTMMILSEQGSTVSIDNAGSTVNLSEDDFSCSAQDIGTYNFFTNTTKIIVRTNAPLDEAVTVRLWNTEDKNENILLSHMDENQETCIFTNLSSQNRYLITIDNMPDISITVSSQLTFWEAFLQAMQNK